MRTEADTNFFDGLRRPWGKLPSHDSLLSFFGKNRISTPDFRLRNCAGSRDRDAEAHQSADLGHTQRVGVLRVHSGQNFSVC